MSETTKQPTFADFGELLTDAVLDANKVKDDDGQTDRPAVAENALYVVGTFAEQCANFYVCEPDLRALMEIVNKAALTADGKYEKDKAESAHNALREFVTLIRRVADARAELSSFAEAVDKYDAQASEALKKARAAQKWGLSVGTSATGQPTAAVGSPTDRGESTDAHDATELAAARRTLAQYTDEIEVLKGKLRKANAHVGAVADFYAHLYYLASDKLTDEESKQHEEFRKNHKWTQADNSKTDHGLF